MKLPSIGECYRLWDEYRTPANVRLHIRQVDKVATEMAGLFQVAKPLNRRLIRAGALLHDLLRVIGRGEGQVSLKFFQAAPTFEELDFYRELNLKYAGLNHAEAAAKLVVELGYDQALARVIRAHDYSLILDPVEGPVTWEEKIVYYADKRVMHDQVVSLEKRLQDGRERYPHHFGTNTARDQLLQAAVMELEAELFAHLPFGPDALGGG